MILCNVKQYGKFIPARRHHRLFECKQESKFYCFGSVLLSEPATTTCSKCPHDSLLPLPLLPIFTQASVILVGVSRGYTDHHQGRGQP